jgi:hypothetical protein
LFATKHRRVYHPLNFFFTNRFYYAIGIIASLFIFSWLMEFSMQVSMVLITCVTILTLADAAVLFLNRRGIKSERWMSDRFSNGDKNLVQLHLTSYYGF